MGIIIDKQGDIAEIILDWPDIRNAMGPSEARELRLALEEVGATDEVGAIILTSSGKAFCAGGNLPEIVQLAEKGKAAVQATIYSEFQGVFRVIAECPVPVIAAIDGAAIGFGCDLAIAGSVTFIGAQGWLAQGWIKAGLIPATGGTYYVARRGGSQAVWRMLAAERVDGPTAEKWGLAIACEDAREAALKMAATFASFPRSPLRAMTQLARIEDREAHLAAALDFQSGLITDSAFADFARRLLKK